MGDLDGRVTIVTGAAQGIGLRISEMLAVDGATVVMADIQSKAVRKQAGLVRAGGGRAWPVTVDISRPSSVRQMVSRILDRFHGVDALINNAGLDAPSGEAWTESDKHWRTILDVDLSGPWWCTKAVLPHMLAKRGGRIVFISSVAARRGSPEISISYNAAKAGLIGLTLALAAQVEGQGVLVNAIAPGPTGDTGQPVTQQEREDYERLYPLGYGGADPIGHACLYLLRDSGDWISGAVLNVSGGGWKGI